MRLATWILLLGCLVLSPSAWAGDSGRIIKVLPHLMDAKGRHTLSPSLYERDAYQQYLRRHPEERSGIRFDVQWKGDRSLDWELRMEVRATQTVPGKPKVLVLDLPKPGWFSKWSEVRITGEDYKALGDVTAWRATLWQGGQQVDELKSFLW